MQKTAILAAFLLALTQPVHADTGSLCAFVKSMIESSPTGMDEVKKGAKDRGFSDAQLTAFLRKCGIKGK